MDGYVGFHAALRRSYNTFIQDLAKQCKQLVRHHLDSVTSPYSNVCYENNIPQGSRLHQVNYSSLFFDLSDSATAQEDIVSADQENIPPRNQQRTPPAKPTGDLKEPLTEGQLTVPETPSPDQPSDSLYGVNKKKEAGNCMEMGARKRQARIFNGGRTGNLNRNENIINGDCGGGSGSGSAYMEICSSAALYFARIREVLIERNAPSTLNSGFLVPCQDRLLVAIGLELFAVDDEKFMDMFVAPGAIDALQSKRQSLCKRQKILQSCLNEFRSIARGL